MIVGWLTRVSRGILGLLGGGEEGEMAAPDADYFEQMEAHLRFDLEMEVLDLAEAPTLLDGNAAPPAAPLALGPVQLSLRQELAKARRIESAASSRQVKKKKSKASLQKCSSSSSELRRSRRLVTMADERQEAADTKNSDGGRELEDTSDGDNRAVVALEGDSKEQNGEDIDKAASLEEKGVEDRASAGNGGERETNHTSEAMAVPQTREEGGSEENGEEDKAALLEENGGVPKEGGEEQETEDASEAMVVPETRGEGGSEGNGGNGAALLDPRDGGNGAAVEAIKDTSEAVAAPEPKEGGDDGEDEAAAREEQEVNEEGRGHFASKEIGRGGDEETKDRSEAVVAPEPKETDVGEGKAAALEEEDGAAVKEVKEEGGEQDAAAEEVKQNGRDECNDQGGHSETSQELVTSSVNEQKQQVKSKNDASSDADALKPARKRPQPRGRREVRGKRNAGNEIRKAGDSVFEARDGDATTTVTAPTAMKKTKRQRAIAAATMDPARAGSGGIRGKRRDGEKGCRLDVQTEPELNGGLVQPLNRESGKNSRGLVENRPGLLERDIEIVLESEEPQSNRVDLVENDIEIVLDCEEELYDEVAADAVLPIAEADEHHASGRRESGAKKQRTPPQTHVEQGDGVGSDDKVSSGQRLRKEVYDLVGGSGRPSKKSKPERRHGSHGSKTKTDDKHKRRRQGTGVLQRDETQQIRRVRTRSAAKVELPIDPGRHEREAAAAGVGSAAAETDANHKAARVHRCQSSNSSQPEAETVETVCVRGSRINRKRGVPI